MLVRNAERADLDAIGRIYNQGIEDRVATLEVEPKSPQEMAAWWEAHGDRYAVVVAVDDVRQIAGWASLNRFSQRCAHADVADLSVYVARDRRGRGIGLLLLAELNERAIRGGFHKIVLHALDTNESGKKLYRRAGFEAVGVFHEHGRIDGRYADVIAMEKIL